MALRALSEGTSTEKAGSDATSGAESPSRSKLLMSRELPDPFLDRVPMGRQTQPRGGANLDKGGEASAHLHILFCQTTERGQTGF